MEEQPISQGRTPIWVPIVLGFQFLLTVIIFGLSANIIHGKYFDTLGFVIFLCLLTWLLIVFHFTTLYISSLAKFRFPYVGLATNAFMVIFWLSAMGAAAALRATFKYSVTIEGCYDNGQSINSSTCLVSKRELERRAAVATQRGLSMMSAIAGLSALVLITYIACLVIEILAWNKTRQHSSSAGPTPQKQGEAGYEGYRMEAPQQPVEIPMQQQQQPYDSQQIYVQQPYQGAPQGGVQQPQQTYVQQPYQQPHVQQSGAQQGYEMPQGVPPQGQQGHTYSAGYQ